MNNFQNANRLFVLTKEAYIDLSDYETPIKYTLEAPVI